MPDTLAVRLCILKTHGKPMELPCANDCDTLHARRTACGCMVVMMTADGAVRRVPSSCFVLQLMSLAFPKLLSLQWLSKAVYFDLSGVLRCVPILALAFACQTSVGLPVILSPLLSPSQCHHCCHCHEK